MTQSVKHPALGFGSGHDLTVRDLEPHIRLCADIMEPVWDSLSLSLSLSLPLCAPPLLALTPMRARAHTHTHTHTHTFSLKNKTDLKTFF